MAKRSTLHPADTIIELFTTGRLTDEAARKLEMHLLMCDTCCAKLAAEDNFGEAVRLGMQDIPAAENARVENIDAPSSRIVPKLLR